MLFLVCIEQYEVKTDSDSEVPPYPLAVQLVN